MREGGEGRVFRAAGRGGGMWRGAGSDSLPDHRAEGKKIGG